LGESGWWGGPSGRIASSIIILGSETNLAYGC